MSMSSGVLRLLVVISGTLALTIGMPSPFQGPALPIVVGGLALVPAIVPGSWVPLAVELLAIMAWLTRTVFLAEPVEFVPLLGLAGSLYAHHTLCALAEAIPLNAIVTPAVFAQWIVRSVPALAASTIAAIAVAGLPDGIHNTAPLAVVLLGVLLVPAVIAIPVYLFRQR